jgi:tRNA dimethylallyltransferase
LQNDKIPIIAGGTGFYIDASVGRVPLPDIPPDAVLRKKLERLSAGALMKILQKAGPTRARTIIKNNEQNNKRRIIRSLEIARSSLRSKRIKHSETMHLGTKFPSPQMMDLRSPSFDMLWVGVTPGSEKLRKRIHARLIARMRRGMVAEARQLHEKGLSWKRMEELGLEYRYLARYLRGYTSKNEMVEQIEAKIWQYSRRQMTYWKRNKNIQWFKPSEEKRIKKAVKDFLAD